MAARPLLSLWGAGKSFQGTVALAGADLDLHPGEIVALVGANGAGQSTPVKIICGVYKPDAGELLIEGQPVVFNDVTAALPAGIAVAHQQVKPGRATVQGTLVEVFIIGMLDNGLSLMGAPFYAQNIVRGVVMIAAVSFAVLRGEIRFF